MTTTEETKQKIELTEQKSINNTDKLNDLKQLLVAIDDKQIELHKNDILHILGGINNVLNIYINHTNLLNDAQINELHELLLPNNIKQLHSYKSISTVSVNIMDDINNDTVYDGDFSKHSGPIHIDNNKGKPELERHITENVKVQQKKFKLYLNKKNDFWHKILSQENVADKIVDFTLYSKWSYFMIVFVFLLSLLCRWIFPLFQAIPATLCIVWFICFLLTFNVSMMKRMMQSFVFWYKMYNWIIFIICYILLFYNANSGNGLEFIEVTNWFAGTLGIMAVSSHDGCKWNNKIKICTGILVWFCVVGMYIFIYFEGKSEYFGGHWHFDEDTITIFNQPISIKSNCLNALFNLQLFIGKQVLSMMKFKNKASVLSIRPYIVWCDNLKEMQNRLALAMQYSSKSTIQIAN